VIPDDPNTFEPAGQAWGDLGTFVAGADGKLRIELSDDNFGDGVLNLTPDGLFMVDGEFIVAGRARLFQENFEDTTEQIITNEDTAGPNPKYQEVTVALTPAFIPAAGDVALLNGRNLPQDVLDKLAQPSMKPAIRS
jgi:hypothetical protein